MLSIKSGMKLSAILDKMDIVITNPKASQEEVGADLMIQLVKKAHKAEKELYEFISTYKNCTTKEAEDLDLIAVIKDITRDEGIVSFFKNAVK